MLVSNIYGSDSDLECVIESDWLYFVKMGLDSDIVNVRDSVCLLSLIFGCDSAIDRVTDDVRAFISEVPLNTPSLNCLLLKMRFHLL